MAPEQRFEGRDLAVTTDYRDVVAEVALGHLGLTKVDRLLPGHRLDEGKLLGLLAP